MSVDVRHAATTRAPLERASRIILSPDSLPRWFKGARVESHDPSWPAVGTRMTFRVWSSTFVATVTENALPARLVMDVETPSGLSRITHTFDAAPAGGWRYAKRVEARRDETGALGDWMLRMVLRGSVKREVERAARVADEAA